MKHKKRIIVVLGMHRSGTSVITRALQVMGVDLGDRLMPGSPDNEKGFWEDQDITLFNVELLKQLSSGWDALAPIPHDGLRSGKIEIFREKAAALLREKTKSSMVFGMKDPRIVRLLPFWQEIFTACDLAPSYVVVIRNPLSVSKSLEKRNDFASEKSYYLWITHALPSVLQTEACPRVVVDYDLFLEQPEKEIQRIARALGLIDKVDLRERQKFTDGFLEKRLRHARHAARDLAQDPGAPPQVAVIFNLLQKMASDELSVDAPEVKNFLSEASKHFKELYPALCYMTRQDETIAERNRQLLNFQRVIAKRDESIEGLQKTVLQRDGKIAGLQKTVLQRDGKIAGLEQTVSKLGRSLDERDVRNVGLNQTVAELDKIIVRFNQSMAERDRQITQHNFTAVKLQTQIRAFENELRYFHDAKAWKLAVKVTSLVSLGERGFLKIKLGIQSMLGGLGKLLRSIRKLFLLLVWKVYRLIPIAHDQREKILRFFQARFPAIYYRMEFLIQRPFFDPEAYLKQNPDVKKSGLYPYEHYVRFGRAEGRSVMGIPSSDQKVQKAVPTARRTEGEVVCNHSADFTSVNIDKQRTISSHQGIQLKDLHISEDYPGHLQPSGTRMPRRIVLVSHDAHPHGAQYLSLSFAKTLFLDFGIKVDLVLLGGGSLMPEFKRWATVHNLTGLNPCGHEAHALAQQFFADGHRSALVNTMAGGLFLGTLASAGLRCIALIHELPSVVESLKLHAHAAPIAERAAYIVFPAQLVADSFQKMTGCSTERFKIKHQGLYKKNIFREHKDAARKLLRKELGISESAKIILGVGSSDRRKGSDLFLEAGMEIIARHEDVFFVWLGRMLPEAKELFMKRLEGSDGASHILIPGFKQDTDIYYAGADIFALPSREDPFPSVVMESLDVSVPVVAFKGAGGFEELLGKGCGILAPQETGACLAEAISDLLNDPEKAHDLGNRGAMLMRQEPFSFRHYVYDLLNWAGEPLKRVSAVIPNYNYKNHLELRIRSILSQSYPLYELIVLDDASTDGSNEVIKNHLSGCVVDHQIIRNTKNSGSVFRQWKKAIESSKGDLLWIAEADDLATPDFLERLVKAFDDPSVVLAYCQSKAIDENGFVLTENYLGYTRDVSDIWQNNYVRSGLEEINEAQCVKNTIPNVSAVLFRRSAIEKAFETIGDDLFNYRVAGDWLVYLHVLLQGRVSFCAESLNMHRRHPASVTQLMSKNGHLEEVRRLQEIARSLGDPSEEVLNKARIYIDFLKDFLQLPPGGAPVKSLRPIR